MASISLTAVLGLASLLAGSPPAPEAEDRRARFAQAAAAVVAIVPEDDVETLCHATAVGAGGLVVTKASTLDDRGDLLAQLPATGEISPAVIRWVDKVNDLAVLETGFDDLAPTEFAEGDPERAVGSLVLAVDPSEEAPRLGVIAARTRQIEKRSGMLGVMLDFRKRRARIDEVYPNTAAAQAGLLAGDVVLSVDGVGVGTSPALQKQIFSRDPGERVQLVVERDGARQELEVQLGYFSDIDSLIDRNQLLSGTTSRRKTGFSQVFQHDIPLAAEEMGTPLLDMEGRLIGLNIARVDRVTTYALPAALLKEALEDAGRADNGDDR